MLDVRIFMEMPAPMPLGLDVKLSKAVSEAVKKCYGIQDNVTVTVVPYENTAFSGLHTFVHVHDLRHTPDQHMERECCKAIKKVLAPELGTPIIHFREFGGVDS